MPSICNSMPQTGPPISEDAGIPTRNQASIRVRYWIGNQAARKKVTPGKKPASAMPSNRRKP